jgi:signal transduction histidine kinase
MSNQQKMPLLPGEAAIHSYLQLLARYERLNEISQKLNSTLDLRTLLNIIIGSATELTDTEEASILLVDEGTGELRFEAATRLTPGAMEAFVVPKDNSIAGWIVAHNEPVLVEDAQSDPRLYRVVDNTVKYSTRNLLGVPMSAKGNVIGVVEAINKRGDAIWTEDDVDALRALAAQAAIAIVNARLFQQNDFISEIVHELRTPLAALKASTTLLLRPDLPEKRRNEIVVTMQEETDRLARLTTDFLDLARLESGRAKMETTRFNIIDLLNESVEIVRPQATERGVTISVSGAADTLLEGDRGKTKQVLLNLFTNAIKYNREQGQIFATVTPEPIDPEAEEFGHKVTRYVRVAVRDTGVGISKENLPRMFEKFYRVADTAGYTQGTGLGLVIARKIVEAHGGTMGVESEVGEGTTLFFTMPLAEVESPRATATMPAAPDAA